MATVRSTPSSSCSSYAVFDDEKYLGNYIICAYNRRIDHEIGTTFKFLVRYSVCWPLFFFMVFHSRYVFQRQICLEIHHQRGLNKKKGELCVTILLVARLSKSRLIHSADRKSLIVSLFPFQSLLIVSFNVIRLCT